MDRRRASPESRNRHGSPLLGQASRSLPADQRALAARHRYLRALRTRCPAGGPAPPAPRAASPLAAGLTPGRSTAGPGRSRAVDRPRGPETPGRAARGYPRRARPPRPCHPVRMARVQPLPRVQLPPGGRTRALPPPRLPIRPTMPTAGPPAPRGCRPEPAGPFALPRSPLHGEHACAPILARTCIRVKGTGMPSRCPGRPRWPPYLLTPWTCLPPVPVRTPVCKPAPICGIIPSQGP